MRPRPRLQSAVWFWELAGHAESESGNGESVRQCFWIALSIRWPTLVPVFDEAAVLSPTMRLRNASPVLGLILVNAAVAGAQPPQPEEGFTLAILPDTQNYVWKRPELYALQTAWIAANVDRYRI